MSDAVLKRLRLDPSGPAAALAVSGTQWQWVGAHIQMEGSHTTDETSDIERRNRSSRVLFVKRRCIACAQRMCPNCAPFFAFAAAFVLRRDGLFPQNHCTDY